MNTITEERIWAFGSLLEEEEKSEATRQKYLGWVRRFANWLGEESLSKEAAVCYRELLREAKQPSTVNTAVSALNRLFSFLGRSDCRIRFLRIQRSIYRDECRELTREEYRRLVSAALGQGNERLALVMETICSCGLRVSELGGVTVEAVQRGEATIAMKGKTRRVLIPSRLCRKLLKYAREKGIRSGAVFAAKTGRSLSRKQIWAEMKALCRRAGVAASKVFPHNLRHLFARVYYQAYKDIVRLADILGHSSVNTTRIYLISTGKEHQRQLERLELVG